MAKPLISHLLPLVVCPFCGKQSYNKGDMVAHHFNNCKFKN